MKSKVIQTIIQTITSIILTLFYFLKIGTIPGIIVLFIFTILLTLQWFTIYEIWRD